MSILNYLIDTNVVIGLEDNRAVEPAYASLLSVASKHHVGVFIHEAARDDILRDKDVDRQKISLSKLDKFQQIDKVRDLEKHTLEDLFGPLPKANDVVDAILLHALIIEAADFLVTQDNGIHSRARAYSTELSRRVLRVVDAVDHLKTTYEPTSSPVRYVEEVQANTINLADNIFDSLREGYPEFDDWWRLKCVRQRRKCWVVIDGDIAGIVVPKDESGIDTDAVTPANKILKVCTFKVRPEKRGVKLGELLLRKVFWHAQSNGYDLVYVTTFSEQESLVELLSYYGFIHTDTKQNGELVYEKIFSSGKLTRVVGENLFQTIRSNYPRFCTSSDIRAFCIPIREAYHDALYPDLKNKRQGDMFENIGAGQAPRRPGNTIRKVYLCRAQSNLGDPGSLLFFYKSKSAEEPSQAVTAIGVLESLSEGRSTKDLLRLTGGRSVYTEVELEGFNASADRPVKVINFLLTGYFDPSVCFEELRRNTVIRTHPPQSIWELKGPASPYLLSLLNLGFTL